MGRDLVSIREFAEIMEVSDTMVHKWIRKDKITVDSIDRSNPSRPRIRVSSAKRDLDANRDMKSKMRNDIAFGKAVVDTPQKTPKREKLVNQLAERVPHSPEELQAMTISQLILLKEAKSVELMDIKIGEASKELVRTELVYDRLFSFIQPVRDLFLNIGQRTVDELIAVYPDRGKMVHVLTKEANDILTRLSNMQEDVRLL